MKRLIIDNLKKTGSLFGIIGLIGGTVSDILQPLFPFVSYIFFFTSITSILLFLTLFLAKSLQTKIIPAFLCSFFIMFFSGIFYFFQGEQKLENGFLAETIPLISSLQSSIGLLQDDISQIKKTTENIEETTEQIVTKLDEIQKEFSEINKSNGIIDNPTKPEQFYHNARIQELGGDYINARKSYNSYFAFKLDFIDPHLRYQTFLKIQEGSAGAREIYSTIYERDSRPIVEFVRILLFNSPTRTKMLHDFILRNPDFTPAFYELSKEYSEIRKGIQSQSDKKKELKYLEKFMSLKNEGKFLKYFVDNEIASEWISYAEKRIKALSTLSNIIKNVTFNTILSNQGWLLNLQIIEPAKEILYKIGDEEEYTSTGLSGYVDLKTNLEMPNTSISMPKDKETMNTIIYVKYKNINNEMMGPFNLNFNGLEEYKKSSKRILNNLPIWISFDDRANYERWGFIGIMPYRCAISKIRYRFIKVSNVSKWKETELPYLRPKCDIANINPSRTSQFSDSVFFKYSNDPGTESEFFRLTHIEMQIIFYDGESSKILKFSRPPLRYN